MPVNLCQKKLYLLREYVAALSVHNADVREYSDMIGASIDGELLPMLKTRIEQSRDKTTEARERYFNHLKEHGCELQLDAGQKS